MAWKVNKGKQKIAARAGYFSSCVLMLCLILCAEGIGSYRFFSAALSSLSLIQLLFLFLQKDFLQQKEIRQLFPVYLFFAFFMDAAFLGDGFAGAEDALWKVFLVLFVLCNGGAFFLFAALIRSGDGRKLLPSRTALREWLPPCAIILLFVVYCLDIYSMSMRVDSWVYYAETADAAAWNFDFLDLTPLRMAEHYTYGYTLWTMIGEYLLPYNAWGVLTIQIVMGTVTVLCVYRILRKFCVNKWLAVIGTAIFAFSPAFGGIVGEVNADFGLTCFFIWMFYCHVYDLRLLEVAAGIFFCFSKESALFTYTGYVFGMFLIDLFRWRKRNEKRLSLRSLFVDYRTPLMCLPGLFWGLHIFCRGFSFWREDAWTGGFPAAELPERRVNLFGLDGLYLKSQSENLFIMHFSWLLILCVFVGLAVLLIRKRTRGISGPAVLLSASCIGYLSIELLYITYLSYRYDQLNIFFLVVGFICVLDRLEWKRIACSTACLVLMLMAVENFYIADPLTKALFQPVDIGDTQVVSTWTFFANPSNYYEMVTKPASVARRAMRNGTANNRQYVYFGKLMNMAVSDIGYDRETALIAPWAFGDSTPGSIFGRQKLKDVGLICYDTKNSVLLLNNAHPEYLEKPGILPLNLYWQKNMTKPVNTEGEQYQDIYYLAFPFSQEKNESFRQSHQILETREYAYRGWRMQLWKVAP